MFTKAELKKAVVRKFSKDTHIKRIIIFGSFLTSTKPNDMDIAIFSDSNEDYLSLAMRYRKKLRDIALKIPLDIIPIRYNYNYENQFLDEINSGEIIYERRD
ncbi:MAG: nucleotidyltransferase domain-containing protein [Candidatus Cloacimonadota bacterium]|nr:nucleotidyltransferase domain-containing protein [Candidatus Cloacimonadota bacterium]